MRLHGAVVPVAVMTAAVAVCLFTVAWLVRHPENEYVCQFQSSTEVLCYDHDGSIFKLFQRAPGKFVVRLYEPIAEGKP